MFEQKQQLKSDCEKEIEEVVAQLRGKYDAKLQDVEATFVLKKMELDINQKKVTMNKILADAFRSKCMDVKASGAPGVQQGITLLSKLSLFYSLFVSISALTRNLICELGLTCLIGLVQDLLVVLSNFLFIISLTEFSPFVLSYNLY